MGHKILILCLIFGLWTVAPAAAEPAYPGAYRAELIRVIDGDTILARVSVWPDVEITTYIRLAGIDAPERGEEGGAAAKAGFESLLRSQHLLILNPRPGKYARRIIADLRLRDGSDPAKLLIEAGLAVPYSP